MDDNTILKRQETLSKLERWFSQQRMLRFRDHPNPEALYLWNTHLSKAFLEDIQHCEVLLRNSMHLAISQRYGTSWFTRTDLNFSNRDRKAVAKAIQRSSRSKTVAIDPNRIIPELTLDFWRFLLTKSHQATLWPLIARHLQISTSRQHFEKLVRTVYNLRNRCAHHEPLVDCDLVYEKARIQSFQEAILAVARHIDPQAALWIEKHSRIPHILNERPPAVDE